MSFGKWGGRFPVGNMLVSGLFFEAVRLRLAYLKLRNQLRPPKIDAPASPAKSQLRSELELWLSRGFDKLNVGGGPKNLAGFVNVDFVHYPNVTRQIAADIRDLSFIPDGSMSHVHSNHVLEHLSLADLNAQLCQYRRVLRPGGHISIRCPNALGAAYGFWFDPTLESGRDEFVALGFPADESFGSPDDKWCYRDTFGVLHWFYGDVGNVTNSHLTRITPSLMHNCLTNAGFKVLKMSEPEALNLVVVAEPAER